MIVGELIGLGKEAFGEFLSLLHHPEHDENDALVGMPRSPGRVSGPARVVRCVDELDRLKPGEILVAPVTTPTWTLALSRALAVVTDTGSIASHVSIVARARHPCGGRDRQRHGAHRRRTTDHGGWRPGRRPLGDGRLAITAAT